VSVCFFSIPLPVKVTLIIGEPIIPAEGEDIHDLVARCHKATEALIKAHNPTAPGTDYIGALRERWRLGFRTPPRHQHTKKVD
jgi:hypothetical protein